MDKTHCFNIYGINKNSPYRVLEAIQFQARFLHCMCNKNNVTTHSPYTGAVIKQKNHYLLKL